MLITDQILTKYKACAEGIEWYHNKYAEPVDIDTILNEWNAKMILKYSIGGISI